MTRIRAPAEDDSKSSRTARSAPERAVATGEQEDVEMGEFEDQFEDEFESESEDGSVHGDAQSDQEMTNANDNGIDNDNDNGSNDANDEDEDGEDGTDANGSSKVSVYLPGAPLEEGEELQADQSVYHMLYSMTVKWPSLSFDILRDRLGNDRKTFPHTAYVVCGSQADRPLSNEITVMKMSQMTSTQTKDAQDKDESDDEDDDYVDKVPSLTSRTFPFFGCVNRIRAMKNTVSDSQFVAAWSDTKSRGVDIFDITKIVNSLESGPAVSKEKLSATHTVTGHSTEGYGMDWSSKAEGSLVTGDNCGVIRLTQATAAGFQTTSTFSGSSQSVEDLQWSPNEATVFASCGTDGYVRIFDTRIGSAPGISASVATVDVNVISWNPLTPFLLASGHDDGVFAIWDLRMLAASKAKAGAASAAAAAVVPAAKFTWHRDAITSLQWHTHEESMIGVAGADDQITIWDLSTERDEEDDSPVDLSGGKVPAQLLFVHQGQEHVKEIHWHAQIPGCMISTAASGFNIFKTINS